MEGEAVSEADLSAAVAEYLALRFDVLITRVEAGGTSRRRITAPGTADWCGVVQGGRHIELELKTRTGKLRNLQLDRARRVTRLGGVYAICRSVQDVADAIERARR